VKRDRDGMVPKWGGEREREGEGYITGVHKSANAVPHHSDPTEAKYTKYKTFCDWRRDSVWSNAI